MGGAMTWVSERHLVSAISNAGGFGVIASRLDVARAARRRRSPATAALTDTPFGVNLITMHPAADGADRGLPRPQGRPCRAGRRPAARRRDRTRIKQGGAKVMCFAPALVIAQQAGALGRRRHRHRGHGGGRPYRPGLDQRAGAGDPAGDPRGAGVRRRRHRPRRGDRRLSRDGRLRLPARHALRLRDRIDRPSEFQAGLLPRRGARCGAVGAARSALPGDPGARARQQRRPSGSSRSSAR